MTVRVVTSGFWLWFLNRLSLDGFTTYWAIYVRPMEANRMHTVIKHERCHEAQMKHEGYVKFTIKYLYYWAKYSYRFNPYEIEARKIAGQEI